MGVCNISEIFQEKVSKIFEVYNRVCVYVGNVIVITLDALINHAKAAGKVLHKPTESGLKIKAKYLSFGRT